MPHKLAKVEGMFESTYHVDMLPCLAAVPGRWNDHEANANDSTMFPGTAACQP
jgi:hypothetical protein